MDEKQMRAMSDFITQRVNDLGTDAPEAVSDAIIVVEERKERLAATLTSEQGTLLRKLENAIHLLAGEEVRYYYRSGFHDAVRFLMGWNRRV
jgi:hypothetical protein